MEKKIVAWELDSFEMDPIDTIALVDDPAIEVGWVALAKEKKKSFKLSKEELADFIMLDAMAEEQTRQYTFDVPKERFDALRGSKTIIAPALIVDKLIFRLDEEGEPYYGYFPENTVRKLADSFMKNKNTDSFNLMHDSGRMTEGVYLTQSWIVEDTQTDKAYHFGYKLPRGSWMVELRVENDELWDEFIASNELRGLSIEAYLVEKIILSKEGLDSSIKSQ